MKVSERLKAMGLAPSTATMAKERAEERQLARVDIARARARARNLQRRAARKPLNSNGRVKDERTAQALLAAAAGMAQAQGLEG